jgi:predicted MFS family arabinose efflux permease
MREDGVVPTAIDRDDSTTQRTLTTGLLTLMAIATGISVGGNYLAQPLVVSIGRSFGVEGAAAGVIVTVAQVSYALGLLFIVPLGHILEKRRLIVTLLIVTALGQALCGLAWSFPVMIAGTAIAGLFSVAAQVLVPFSAELAREGRAGSAVGVVMSGLLLGTLLARTISGVVSTLFGWHVVFEGAAVAMAICAVALAFRLPASPPLVRTSYARTLGSVFGLFRTIPRLRTRAAIGAVGFGAASAIFATMTLLLAGPPFGLNDAAIGLIGLFAVAGAMAAQVSGKLTDRGRTGTVLLLALAAAVLGAFALWLGGTNLIAFMAGMLFYDFALQATQVNNQATLYSLKPSARPLLTSAYMTSYFIGGTLGSAGALLIWPQWGWNGVVVLVAVLILAGLTLGIVDGRLARRERRSVVNDPCQDGRASSVRA